MAPKHFLDLADFSSPEVKNFLTMAQKIKANPRGYRRTCKGKSLAMYFEKASTRTRLSFDVAIHELGGHPIYLAANDLQLARGESVADTALVLSRFVHVIMARTFSHQLMLDLAKFATVPVINGLTDFSHPCQALADFMTIREFKPKISGLTLAYVGDGNNVAHSLIQGAVRVGVNIRVACPPGFEPQEQVVAQARELAVRKRLQVAVMHDPEAAVRGADVVYTDTWVSMGQEKDRAKKLKAFEGFQVNERLFNLARRDAIFMHCLPAHRGEEVTDAVCDHQRSVIFQQAENRLHVQKAILVALIGGPVVSRYRMI